jgi:hypothetical protein
LCSDFKRRARRYGTNPPQLHCLGDVLFGLILTREETYAKAAPDQTAGKKPNIVFILVDNLGYGELGVYGGGILRGAPTTRIDKLASEGTRLLNFNVEAQCTPSRSAPH